jgi:phosphatidylinositol alpha 1,6-mannosyltransferase
VGYVGLAAEKELDLLTHLLDLQGVELVVVGSGPDESRLRALLPTAQFRGMLRGGELAQEHADLDVFVHTGRHETYCQSAQEALASGLLVVAPRAGGLIDVVPDGAGYLHPPGDGAALRAHVSTLANDPVLRLRSGRVARVAVEGRTWDLVGSMLVNHYRDVISGRHMPAGRDAYADRSSPW